ncbi:MAG: hypothetical protein Q8L95_03205 [Burkholderiales bacterium]|nr:hypothetical protein [Burkholderiales bacterium]
MTATIMPIAPPAPAWVIVALITCGLLVDQHLVVWGQAIISFATWAVLLYWMTQSSPATRLNLAICVVYATLGEIFLSLVWGLYDYRLGNIPLFVPPGHALLFALGVILATRLPEWITWAVPLTAAPLIIALALNGSDTLGPPLFALLLICMAFSRARKLYAVMFMLALTMEIYGTTLGNWAWHQEVPWPGLATLNPPLAAGAFYCVLDLLVVTTATLFTRWGKATSQPQLAKRR